jgi:hypothetical protein
VAAQDEGSPVHGWEENVEHLHGGNFSITARWVRPLARGFRGALRVVCRQSARNEISRKAGKP